MNVLNKLLVIVNLKGSLGGAEIRYLALFNELSKRKNDYTLIINRRLYDIAIKSDRLDKYVENIIVLEIDKPISHQLQTKNGSNKSKKGIKKYIAVLKLLNIKNQLFSLLKLIKYSIELNKVFKKHKPSYVYAVWIGGMISWPLKYLYKFKFVYSFMDSGFSSIYPRFSQPLKNERMPLKHADVIDFLSNDLYKEVSKKVNLKEKTRIAISPCTFKNYSNISPASKKENNVVFCSRLTPIKNPLLFLESIKLFNQRYENARNIKFIVLGDGSCLPKLMQFKEGNNLTNVFLKGHVDNPIDFLRFSRIFVSIQQTNNYPSQSLLEAMACENAIIASDVGETRKIVTEEEGILVTLKASEIADALVALLSNEDHRNSLAKNARKKALTDHSANRYLDYFYGLEKMN